MRLASVEPLVGFSLLGAKLPVALGCGSWFAGDFPLLGQKQLDHQGDFAECRRPGRTLRRFFLNRGVQVAASKAIETTLAGPCWRNWRSVIQICSWPRPFTRGPGRDRFAAEAECPGGPDQQGQNPAAPRTLPCPVPMTVTKDLWSAPVRLQGVEAASL